MQCGDRFCADFAHLKQTYSQPKWNGFLASTWRYIDVRCLLGWLRWGWDDGDSPAGSSVFRLHLPSESAVHACLLQQRSELRTLLHQLIRLQRAGEERQVQQRQAQPLQQLPEVLFPLVRPVTDPAEHGGHQNLLSHLQTLAGQQLQNTCFGQAEELFVPKNLLKILVEQSLALLLQRLQHAHCKTWITHCKPWITHCKPWITHCKPWITHCKHESRL